MWFLFLLLFYVVLFIADCLQALIPFMECHKLKNRYLAYLNHECEKDKIQKMQPVLDKYIKIHNYYNPEYCWLEGNRHRRTYELNHIGYLQFSGTIRRAVNYFYDSSKMVLLSKFNPFGILVNFLFLPLYFFRLLGLQPSGFDFFLKFVGVLIQLLTIIKELCVIFIQ